jgi:hypothetical protein
MELHARRITVSVS